MVMGNENRGAFDVLLDGGYFNDLVFTGLPELPRLGHEVYSKDFHLLPGGAYNSAVAMRRLGLRVAWPCHFGSDPFSQYVKEHAIAEKVDPSFFTQMDQSALHLTVAFSFDEERAFLSYSDDYPDEPLANLLNELKPAWFLVSHLAHGQQYEALFRKAHALGTKVYMDCQAHDQSLDDPHVRKALSLTDVFSPNAEEAMKLTGCEHIEDALEVLAQQVPVVIIKLGKEGCVCRCGEQELRIPSMQVEVADTTGAGDNFDSGFLCGQIREFSLADSLRMANICGALSVQGYGGTTTSPTYNQVKRFLE
jgi:sugar/nucleoside kinase (ribokinase family)